MSVNILRKFIAEVFRETEVLGEPDESQEDERDDDDECKDEVNVVANIAGVVTPLGTGPDGGKGKKGKKKKESDPRARAIDANARAWGGGAIYTKERNKF